MLSPPDSRSDGLQDSSTCSSDTGDVLVRSTRVLGPGSVRITVEKLRDAADQPPLSEQQQRPPKLRHKPDIAAPLRAAADSQPGSCADRRTLKKPGPTKENREPTGSQLPAAEWSADRKFSAGTRSGQQPGRDLLTSRFAAGGRGVVLAALKQRSHSAPRRREVKVQLLDPGPLQSTTSSQDAPGLRPGSQDAPGLRAGSQDAVGVQTEAELSPGRPGDATNAAAAAAAAAAVAAAAPLIKAQSDMEARVSQLADGVERLLQADRASVEEGRGLSQRTLQHLETLHSRQLQLQSQLLESALRIVTGHAPVTSATSEAAVTFDLAATGQPACLQVTHLDAAANVLDNQQPSFSATRAAAVETGPVSMATLRRDRWPEQTRDDRYRRGAPGVSRATRPAGRSHLQSSANHGQAAARRANEVLKEMGRLRTEIEMLLTPEDPLNTRPAPDPQQTQQNQSQSQQNQSQSQQNQSQTQKNHHQTQQNQSQTQQNHHQTQQNQSQTQQNHHQTQQNQSQTQQNQSQTQQNQSQTQQNHHQTQQNQSQTQQNLHWPQQNQSQTQQNQSQTQQNQSQTQQNLHWTQQNQSQTQQNHHQTQQNQSQTQQNLHWTQQNHHQTQQNHPQTQQNQSQSQQNHHRTQTHQSQTQRNHHRTQRNQSQSQQNQSLTQQFQSDLVRRRPVVPSTLEEAGLVLRQVQRQKKVLEENLDSLLRAKTGEVLHCQLEALAANRVWTEEVRIKKTVDAWINTLSKDIQAEMSSEDAASKHTSSRDAAVMSQQRAADSKGSAHTGRRRRPVSALRETGSKTVAGRESRGQTAGQKQGAEPDGDGEQAEVDGESYLTRLYGRAPYDGLRRTLKKSPYLRFSSPVSPPGRKSRPRLVESVRGVKVKSCKTQTSLAPPVSSSPGRPQSRYIFSSSHLTSGDPSDLAVTPANAHSVPMAIPLGRPRMDSSSWRPPTQRQQEVTSPPEAPPTAAGTAAADSETPEPHPQEEEQLDADEAPPPPPPSHTVDITERKSEEEEDEEDVFPGTDFLSVTEVVQEEVSVVGEEAVELDGGPSPPPVLYQGPVFPPQARSALPAQEQASVLGSGPQRDALENRLVEWVEQQLMSRMISEMYRPPPADPAQNDSTDQSELEEQSFTSDIVEAAGAGGLQLFVDSSVPVDSALIRQLVNEVLTETVALMLGQRDAPGPDPGQDPPKPGPAAHEEEKLVPLVPTPVPTPPSSPAPPSRETSPLTTPPLSEPTSLLNEESPQPITAPELVATPTPSPETAPSGGSPPAVHHAPPPLTWGDAELPLDEERPEEQLDTHTQPLVMSVAQEEPPLSTPLPPRSPSPPPPPPAPDPRPASSSSESSSSSETSSSSSSSSSSSVVTAGTDAALKHISEGELLISVNQLAAMTEEEAVCSFSSSLQELQEMDFDPPSEGQVRGHDLLLTLLTKMEQGVTHTHRGERPQPEGSWGREEEEEVSVGEVRDDQTTKPHRTTKPRRPTVNATAARWGQTSSPGQISQSADVPEVSFEATNQGSVTLGDLMMEPSGTLTSDLHSNLSLSPPPHLEENTHTAGQVVLVRQFNTQTAEQQQGGTRRMDVRLPSIRPEEEEEEEEEVMEEVISVAADSDSSTNDVF
ncbi:protein TALPID3 isoform X4 [Thunnus thynnus]|uniref:protein TALPID3 isoform X4 n=1 Tax=Thunnus thynnus TaxID=8237 RepID=UPI00352904E8